MERKQVKTAGEVSVSMAVPSAEESAAVFGVNVAKKKIQPIWLEIDNQSDAEWLLLPIHIDHDYYAPLEVSYKFRNRWSKSKSQQKDDFFNNMHIPHMIPPKSVVSGYVYGRREAGIRYAKVMMVQDEHDPVEISFALPIPGVRADYERVDFDSLYSEEEFIHVDDPDKLREELTKLPRCTADK